MRLHNPIVHNGRSANFVQRTLLALASLKLTLAIIVVLVAGIGIIYFSHVRYVWALALPFTAFAVNLAAAVATNPVFRRQTALLVFHLALITIVLLIALGRLTYFKGHTELVEGEEFSGSMVYEESGPWHPRRLNNMLFRNDGFTISYASGMKRGVTRNQVTWTLPDGRPTQSVIGDQYPLLLAGYRIYATANKGFAPVFLWRPDGGQEQVGAVHLPTYPRMQYKQAIEWQPPGSQIKLWIMLPIDQVLLPTDQPSEFRLPTERQLVVRMGQERHTLKPGASIRLPEGELTYMELRKWMGYDISYDFTLPWLLAAGILAVGSMALHFWLKFSTKPWNAEVE